MLSADLHRCTESHKLAEIYTNSRDTSKFDVGRIIYADDDFFVMAAIDQFGKLDGFLLQETESVVRICEDSQYLNKMAALLRYYNEKPDALKIDKYPVFSLLDYCRQNNRIVSIDICGSGLVDAKGYVEELDIDKCGIRQVSELGKHDGSTTVLLNDITYIACCSGQEAMLEILNSEFFDEMHFN